MEALQQKEIIHTSEHFELQKLSHISEGKSRLFVSFNLKTDFAKDFKN